MNPRVWAFDLEMNQPSGKIIQIGVVIGNLLKNEVLTTYNAYINCEESLDPRICQLTGISQNQVDLGKSIDDAKLELNNLLVKYQVCKSPIVWGNGDLRQLKIQGKPSQFNNTYRELDIKTLHQFASLSRGLTMKGGLEASLAVYGLKFKGTPHNALDDALNTFNLACRFQKYFTFWNKMVEFS